jgi:hypothetical protein
MQAVPARGPAVLIETTPVSPSLNSVGRDSVEYLSGRQGPPSNAPLGGPTHFVSISLAWSALGLCRNRLRCARQEATEPRAFIGTGPLERNQTATEERVVQCTTDRGVSHDGLFVTER